MVFRGRPGGVIVIALVSGLSGPGSGPGLGHCVVFLGKTLYSHVPLTTQTQVAQRWVALSSGVSGCPLKSDLSVDNVIHLSNNWGQVYNGYR